MKKNAFENFKPIYLKEYNEKVKDFKELISVFLLKKFPDGRLMYSPSATYYDKDYSKLQCQPKANRSLSDVCMLVRTYFHDVFDSEIIYYIFKEKYGLSYCPDVNKIVITYYGTSSKLINYSQDDIDWFDNDIVYEYTDESHENWGLYNGTTKDAMFLKDYFNLIHCLLY